MVNRCVYCKREIVDERALDVCTPCGHGIWGDKMFKAILDNMGNAKQKGDLYQGSVTDSKVSR